MDWDLTNEYPLYHSNISSVRVMSMLLIFSSKCFIDVAPITLLVTKGLLITKALAKVLGSEYYIF